MQKRRVGVVHHFQFNFYESVFARQYLKNMRKLFSSLFASFIFSLYAATSLSEEITDHSVAQKKSVNFVHPSDTPNSSEIINPRFLADVKLQSADELEEMLRRVEMMMEQGGLSLSASNPVVFLLHGPEALSFFKTNYKKNKELADLAAKLSAYGVADINVCETWMGSKRLDKNDLLPFVSTVPYAPESVKQLVEKEGYIFF